LRVVNRTTGLAPTLVDSLLVVGLAWSASANQGAQFLTVIAFCLDARLAPARRRPYVFAVASLALACARPHQPGALSLSALAAASAVALAFLPLCWRASFASRTDVGEQPLSTSRVQWGRVLALATWLVTAALYGWDGLYSLLPLGAALLGAALYAAGRIR
jgi:hypothetical protein